MTKNSVLATSLPSWNSAVSFSKSISFYISGILCVGMVLAPAPPSCFPECGCPQWNEIYSFGDRTISLKGNPLDRPHVVNHKQNEFFPIFKERTLSFLPSHLKTENMLLLLKHPYLLLIYRETSAVDMPKRKCYSDAKADQELMGSLSSSACCSQTLSIICQMLWKCFSIDCVETGRSPPAAVQGHLTLDPGSHFPACNGVGGERR